MPIMADIYHMQGMVSGKRPIRHESWIHPMPPQ